MRIFFYVKKKRLRKTKQPKKIVDRPPTVSGLKIFLLAIRILLAAIMVAIPLYLHKTRPLTAIELNISTSYLCLIFDYTEEQKATSYESELLRSVPIGAEQLTISGIDTFNIYSKASDGLLFSEYQVFPSEKEKSRLTFIANEGHFSLVSLQYKGLTKLGVSASDSTFSFFLEPLENSEAWQTFAEVSLAKIFRINYDSNVVTIESSLASLPMENFKSFQFEGVQEAPNLELANLGNQMTLKFEHHKMQEKELLKNIDIKHFTTVRFDPIEKKDRPTVIAGTYKLLDQQGSENQEIAQNSTLKFKANNLRLETLKLTLNVISAKFIGNFSELNICHLENITDVIPSRLSHILSTKIGYFFAGVYIIIFLRIVLGQTLFTFIKDLLR